MSDRAWRSIDTGELLPYPPAMTTDEWIERGERIMDDPVFQASESMMYGDRPLGIAEMHAITLALRHGLRSLVDKFLIKFEQFLNQETSGGDATTTDGIRGGPEGGGTGHAQAD